MSKTMKSRTKGLLVAVGFSAGLFLNAQAATAQQSWPPLSSEQIARIVRSSDRTAADRANDERRKPEQMVSLPITILLPHAIMSILELSTMSSWVNRVVWAGPRRIPLYPYPR